MSTSGQNRQMVKYVLQKALIYEEQFSTDTKLTTFITFIFGNNLH